MSALSDFVILSLSCSFLVTAEAKFLEIYLYLPSATRASKSSPNVSSSKVCLNSSTIGAVSLCISTSIESFSTSFTAWKSGSLTFCPLRAIFTSPIRCARAVSSRTVVPSRSFPLASYAFSIRSLRPVSLSAEIAITGTPSFSCSSAAFILSPAFSTASIILSATTTGTSISRS